MTRFASLSLLLLASCAAGTRAVCPTTVPQPTQQTPAPAAPLAPCVPPPPPPPSFAFPGDEPECKGGMCYVPVYRAPVAHDDGKAAKVIAPLVDLGSHTTLPIVMGVLLLLALASTGWFAVRSRRR